MKINIIFSSLVLMLAVVPPSYAYIDPGSGSLIMTTILGLIAAAGYTVKKYFYKIKNIFSKNNRATKDDDK